MDHSIIVVSSPELPMASRMTLQDGGTSSLAANVGLPTLLQQFQQQTTNSIFPSTGLGEWRLSGEVVAMPADTALSHQGRRKRFRSNSDGSLPVCGLSTTALPKTEDQTAAGVCRMSPQPAAEAESRRASFIRRTHTYTGTFGPLLFAINNKINDTNQTEDPQMMSSLKSQVLSSLQVEPRILAADQQQLHDSGQTSPLDLSENLRRFLHTTDDKYQQVRSTSHLSSHTSSSQSEEAAPAGRASQKSDDNEEVFLTLSANVDGKFAFDFARPHGGEGGEVEASVETSSTVSKLQQLDLLETSGDSERDDTVRTYLTAYGNTKKLKVKQYLQIKYQQSVSSEEGLHEAKRMVFKTEGEDTDTEEDDKLLASRKYHSESEVLDDTEYSGLRHDTLIQLRSASALPEKHVTEERRRRLPLIMRPWATALAERLHPSSSSASEGEGEVTSSADVMLSPGGDVFTPRTDVRHYRSAGVASSATVGAAGAASVHFRSLTLSPRQRFTSTVSEADDISFQHKATSKESSSSPVRSSAERTKQILRQKLQLKKERLQQLQVDQGKSSSTSEDDVIDLTDEHLHNSSSSSAREAVFDLSRSTRSSRSSRSTVSDSSPEIRSMFHVNPLALSTAYQATSHYPFSTLAEADSPRKLNEYLATAWQHLFQDQADVSRLESSSQLLQHRQSQRRKTSDEQVGSRKKTAGKEEEHLLLSATSSADEAGAAAASSSRLQAFQQYAAAHLQPAAAAHLQPAAAPHPFAYNFQRHHHHHHGHHSKTHKVRSTLPRSASTHRHTTPAHSLPDHGGFSSSPETTTAENKNSSTSSRQNKQHKCNVCLRAFSRSDMLARHTRLHTGVRPYACAVCGLVFSRSDHLNTHMRTHTGEKPYKCSHCPYAAPRRDQISRHIRIHVQEAELLRQAAAMGALQTGEGLELAAKLFPAGWFVVSPELTHNDVLLSSTAASLAPDAGVEAKSRSKQRKHAIGSSVHNQSDTLHSRHSDFSQSSSLSFESLTAGAVNSDTALPIAERMASRLFVNSPAHRGTDKESEPLAEGRMSLSPGCLHTADDTAKSKDAKSPSKECERHASHCKLEDAAQSDKATAIAKLKQSICQRQKCEQAAATTPSPSSHPSGSSSEEAGTETHSNIFSSFP